MVDAEDKTHGHKFRAWDKKANRWLSSDLVVIDGEGYIRRFKQNDGWALVDDIEISQWTGLTDSEGREIYTGDIIALEGGADTQFGKVKFEHGCFVFDAPWIKPGSSNPELKYYTAPDFVDTKVIGNKWESAKAVKEE